MTKPSRVYSMDYEGPNCSNLGLAEVFDPEESCLKCFCLLALIFFPLQIFAQQYETLGPNSCGIGQGNCHSKENNWWSNDDHFSTADPFFEPTEKYLKIAKLYGSNPADLAKGNNSCMKCHGTTVSGRETREVEFGVSCESCHGGGGGFKDIHSEKGGYTRALQFGMVEVKNLNTRATTCVRCHFITEPKLISAGHPTGQEFDYVKGIRQKISKHWKHPAESAAQLQPAFASAVSARGPVQQIARVEPAAPIPAPAKQTEATVEIQSASPGATTVAPASVVEEETKAPPANPAPVVRPAKRIAPLPPRRAFEPRPVDPVAIPAEDVGPLLLPPFPAINDSMSVPQVLLILKKRLEYLYQRTGGK